MPISFTEVCAVVRLFLNKAVLSTETGRDGNSNYGRLKGLKALF